jgi:hypothetical protein
MAHGDSTFKLDPLKGAMSFGRGRTDLKILEKRAIRGKPHVSMTCIVLR